MVVFLVVCLIGVAALVGWRYALAIPTAARKVDTARFDEFGKRLGQFRKKVAEDKLLPEAARRSLSQEVADLETRLAEALKPPAESGEARPIPPAFDPDNPRVNPPDKNPPVAVVPPATGGETDILVVVLHSSSFGATPYRDALKSLFQPAAVEARGKGLRVGLMLAIGGEVQKAPAVALGDPKPDLFALDRLGPKPTGVAEQLTALAPEIAARFDPAAKGTRRVVVLASARSAPPEDAAAWKGVAVDAVLVADEARPDPDHILAWHKFADRRNGSVSVLVTDPAGKPDDLLPLVTAQLRRSIRAVPIGEK